MSLTATRSAKVINIFWKMMRTFNFYLKAPIQIYNPLFQLASDNGNGFLQNNQLAPNFFNNTYDTSLDKDI